MTAAARRGVDWWVHRVATSDRYHASPHEIRTAWSFDDLLQAHLALDALQEVLSAQEAAQRRELDRVRSRRGRR